MKLTRASLFLTGFYLCLVVLWLTAAFLEASNSGWHVQSFLQGITNVSYGYIFAFLYGLIPFLGGITGLANTKKWGFFKSTTGKALFFLSTGLIAWGMGEMIWSYYNFFLNQEIPYPSWADLSFILSWPLWSIGVLYLSRATGVKYGLKRKHGRLLLIIIPIITILLSYYLLVVVARQGSFQFDGGLIKIFFDIAYPFLDAVALTLALLVYGLSLKYLGGCFKWPVRIILFGFIVNYVADFAFSYTTTITTFHNGNWVDLIFATAVFVLSFGINSFETENTS